MTDPAQSSAGADVRMRGFHQRATVEATLAWVDNARQLPAETVHVTAAAGRVLCEDVCSEVNVPGFRRSMMDGYAVQAASIAGATPYNGRLLKVTGESMPGDGSEVVVQPGEAVKTMTGAPLPAGADTVLPVEKTSTENARLYAIDETPAGKNIGEIGEDIAAGSLVLSSGRRLRAQDVGVLASIGVGQVPVVRQPRVRIVVTGNELLAPGGKPSGHQIVDSNSVMLAALIARDGGLAVNPGVVPDQPEAILAAMQNEVDVVLVSGGSSVGQEDHAPRLLAANGELAIHGVAMRPSSPAGMGRLGAKLVFLLPGNPVSCLCAYDFFAGRAIRLLAGLSRDWPHRRIQLPLARKLVSAVGRVDYARVRIVSQGVQRVVEPLAISGASVLSSTCRADGFVIVPGDSEGAAAGAVVEVYLYD